MKIILLCSLECFLAMCEVVIRLWTCNIYENHDAREQPSCTTTSSRYSESIVTSCTYAYIAWRLRYQSFQCVNASKEPSVIKFLQLRMRNTWLRQQRRQVEKERWAFSKTSKPVRLLRRSPRSFKQKRLSTFSSSNAQRNKVRIWIK